MTLVERAAQLLREGQLVVFPTETVYGVGANALDEAAVRRIYKAKGRPPTSPLIVHAGSAELARSLVTHWPDAAAALAAKWWPGPLTLVLPKKSHVPEIVTAGLPTVGVRVPSHPLALELLRAAGIPIAAPSANRFSELSPTRADHVKLPGVALTLDGGPCTVGIESTVVSLAGASPVILRPGVIPAAAIEAVIGRLEPYRRTTETDPSPGLHARHYAPQTRLVLAGSQDLPGAGKGAYLYWEKPAPAAHAVTMPRSAAEYAAALYAVLHELDARGLDWIAVEPPPASEEWAGVRDRLRRAATPPDTISREREE